MARTNYIQHLNAFFAQVRKDDRLHANHISLYMALFQIWNQYRFQHCFPILREEVIRLCRIGSYNTYTRCLKDLHSFGYVTYQPAPQKAAPSIITIKHLKNSYLEKDVAQLELFDEFFFEGCSTFSPFLYTIIEGPVSNSPYRNSDTPPYRKNATATCRNSDTPPVAKLRHFNKHINNDKKERENSLSPQKNKKNHASKTSQTESAAVPAPPTLDQVRELFSAAGYPELEARKFFYHYKANGWRQGGKIPITDWQSAAHKWPLNNISQKIDTNDIRKTTGGAPAGRLHANEDKSYSDPL